MCINKFSNNLVCKTNKENEEEHVINSWYTSFHMPYTIYMHANIKKINLTYLCQTLFSCSLIWCIKTKSRKYFKKLKIIYLVSFLFS